nr:MAG TPA: hypothetical protein [Caudoviricetes sp.]
MRKRSGSCKKYLIVDFCRFHALHKKGFSGSVLNVITRLWNAVFRKHTDFSFGFYMDPEKRSGFYAVSDDRKVGLRIGLHEFFCSIFEQHKITPFPRSIIPHRSREYNEKENHHEKNHSYLHHEKAGGSQ